MLVQWAGVAITARVHADSPADAAKEWTQAEQFVWDKIRYGLPANLDGNCDGSYHPDVSDDSNPLWKTECRSLSGKFLESLLTRLPWKEAIPHQGMAIRGARIRGDIDLESAKLVCAVWIFQSRIEG